LTMGLWHLSLDDLAARFPHAYRRGELPARYKAPMLRGRMIISAHSGRGYARDNGPLEDCIFIHYEDGWRCVSLIDYWGYVCV